MIQLKYPPMHKLLEKNIANYEEDDPKNGVIVLNRHAVAINNHSIICFDLNDYFTIKEDKRSGDELQELDTILTFMNGKMFSGAFWEELTKNAIVSIVNDRIHLEGAVKKDLIHDYRSIDTSDIIEGLGKNINNASQAISKSAIYMQPLMLVMGAFKTMLKSDTLILEHIGVNTTVRFTFGENPWLFGILDTDASNTTGAFDFEDMSSFFLSLK